MIEGVRQMVCGSTPQTVWPENGEGWTVEHLDWADPSLQSRPRSLRPNGGWRWWGGRAATGPIVVGCLEVLDWLRGTSWWPDLDGAVLAIETSEEQPGPEVVARFLRTLAASGELARLSGLLFGRPGEAGLDPTDHQAYDEAIVGVVRGEESLEELPVVTGMDFGHTDPMWTIPIGVPVRIDPDLRRVIFLDAGVT
jgi:muramoyltetrapeptide carboxypeptidase LdcA involved in peptidoglycan recycling